MKYDYLIVGAGLFGSVFAERCRAHNLKVLMIDKRNHIGGNCYTDFVDNIHIHKYGPHIFHTSNEEVWRYINNFEIFEPFIYSPVANYNNELYPLPFNMWTFNKLWGVVTPEQARLKIEEQRFLGKPHNLEETALSIVGKELYEKLIYGYTKKQWMKDPKELPCSIIKRIPVRFTYNNNYFNHKYQGIPRNGYTSIFKKMLDGISLELNVDFFSKQKYFENLAKRVLYTGKIDEYYDYCYGELEYRCLNFENQKINSDNYQGSAVINYTNEQIPYTRSIEHKHFDINCKNSKNTIVTNEYPIQYDKNLTPYYPINIERNEKMYDKYKNIPNNKKVIFGGRLGNYKYLDMDQIIAMALNLFNKYHIL